MNKKILISLSVIGAVAAIAVGGTIAYFSDTETSTGNTFTAGTIDIAIDGQNPWTNTFTLADMKPGYTDNITFDIQNTGSGANPVDVYKKLVVTEEETGTQSEPECAADAENGTWNNDTKICTNPQSPNNDLSGQIIYDLNVEVYQGTNKIWWQTLYLDSENKTIDDVYGTNETGEVYLGMIPAGGHMIVKQSYHFNSSAGNVYQGDKMTFSINLRAEQIQGTVVLENKTGAPDWDVINSADTINGTLTYKVKNPTFDFSFTGKAPMLNHNYVLAAGWKANGTGYDVDTYLGQGTSGGDGTISFSGNIELGKDMKNVKVWLVPAENWSGGMIWAGWPIMVPNILWETGLIWYDDTDL